MGIIFSTFQRVSFALILLVFFAGCVRQNTLPPIIPIDLGGDTNNADVNIGVLDLNDTPNSYAGAGSQFVKVNSGATGLEFVSVAGVTDNCSGNNDCNVLGDANVTGTLIVRGHSFFGKGNTGVQTLPGTDIVTIIENTSDTDWTTGISISPIIDSDMLGSTKTGALFAISLRPGFDATSAAVVQALSMTPVSSISSMVGQLVTIKGATFGLNFTVPDGKMLTQATGYEVTNLNLGGTNTKFMRGEAFRCVGTIDANKAYCLTANNPVMLLLSTKLIFGGQTTGAATGTLNNTDGNAYMASCSRVLTDKAGKCIDIGFKSQDVMTDFNSTYVSYYRITDTNFSPTNDNNLFFGTPTKQWITGYFYDGNFVKGIQARDVNVAHQVNFKTGTNQCAGISKLVAGSVTVSTNCMVDNSSVVNLTPQDAGGANIGSVYVSARTANTSFVITSTNILDDRNVSWILNQLN